MNVFRTKRSKCPTWFYQMFRVYVYSICHNGQEDDYSRYDYHQILLSSLTRYCKIALIISFFSWVDSLVFRCTIIFLFIILHFHASTNDLLIRTLMDNLKKSLQQFAREQKILITKVMHVTGWFRFALIFLAIRGCRSRRNTQSRHLFSLRV